MVLGASFLSFAAMAWAQAAPSPEALQRVCESGSSMVDCVELAWLYHDGRGVPRDAERATALFRKACYGGSHAGCLPLCIGGDDAACQRGFRPRLIPMLKELFKDMDPARRRDAVSNSRDIDLLDELGWVERDGSVRETVRQRMREVAKSDPEPARRAAAVERLSSSDGALIADIARTDPDRTVRAAAAKRLADATPTTAEPGKPSEGGAVLTELAIHEPDPKVRKAAVSQLEDPVLLARIARSDHASEVREAAVHNRNLSDGRLLAEIAIKDRDVGVAVTAATRLTDQALLARIAERSRHEDVRRFAVERLEDQRLLASIAEEDASADVRAAAAQRVTDAGALARLALSDRDDAVRETAVSNLHLKDEAVLARVAWKDKRVDVALAAIRRLTDQKTLAEIARSHRDREGAREEATRRLTDQGLLADLARNSTEWGVRDIAVLHLTNEKLLEQIAKADRHSKVREDAVKRMKELQSAQKR